MYMCCSSGIVNTDTDSSLKFIIRTRAHTHTHIERYTRTKSRMSHISVSEYKHVYIYIPFQVSDQSQSVSLRVSTKKTWYYRWQCDYRQMSLLDQMSPIECRYHIYLFVLFFSTITLNFFPLMHFIYLLDSIDHYFFRSFACSLSFFQGE